MQGVKLLTGELVEVELFSSMIVPIWKSPETSDSKDTKTEQSYIPPEQQVRDMQLAGIALSETRRARFSPDGTFDSDLLAEGEEVPLDPTRSGGVDITDVVKIARATGLRLREQDKKQSAEREAAEVARRKKEIDDAVAKAMAELPKGASTQT